MTDGKKKLLFVLYDMNVGGTEKAFLNMAACIPPEKYDITLLLFERRGGYLGDVPEHIRVIELRDYAAIKDIMMKPPLAVAKELWRGGRRADAAAVCFYHVIYKLTHDRSAFYRYFFKDRMLEGEYDAAIAYCGPMDQILVFVSLFVRAKRKLQWIHFDVSKLIMDNEIENRFAKKLDRIFVVSETSRERFNERFPGCAHLTQTLVNIVPEKTAFAAAGDITPYPDNGRLRLLTVGRLSSEKGQDMIPEIVRRLRAACHDSFTWYIVGDGKLRGALEQTQEVAEGSIVLCGTQKNPFPYYKFADVYVQTSHHEGYCITLAEARLFALPVVTTDCAGARDQIDDGVTGYITSDAPEAIADKLVSLFDSAAREAMRQAARRTSAVASEAELSKFYDIIDQ